MLKKWEDEFGKENKFRLLFHSDEKYFTFNWSDHLKVSWEKARADKQVHHTTQGPKKVHIWMAVSPHWGAFAMEVPEDFGMNMVSSYFNSHHTSWLFFAKLVKNQFLRNKTFLDLENTS